MPGFEIFKYILSSHWFSTEVFHQAWPKFCTFSTDFSTRWITHPLRKILNTRFTYYLVRILVFDSCLFVIFLLKK